MSFVDDLKKLIGCGYKVCQFKNINYHPGSNPHWYISVPCNEDSFIFLCMISSKWEKIQNALRENGKIDGKDYLSSLVHLPRDEMGFLTEPKSVINCNSFDAGTPQVLDGLINPTDGFQILPNVVPDNLKARVYKAIQASPDVPDRWKRRVRQA